VTAPTEHVPAGRDGDDDDYHAVYHQAVWITVAQVTLAVHRMDRQTGCCVACECPCPCETANDAANTLAGYGVPIVGPSV
jgi:hypothetical protein